MIVVTVKNGKKKICSIKLKECSVIECHQEPTVPSQILFPICSKEVNTIYGL